MTQLAADITDCRHVLPLLTTPERTEVPWATNRVAEQLMGKAIPPLPGEGQELCIISDAQDVRTLQDTLEIPFGAAVSFYIRAHVCHGPGYRFDLIFLDDKQRTTLNNRCLKILLETIGVMRLEAADIMPLMINQQTRDVQHLSRREISAKVQQAADAALLLDGQFRVVSLNGPMREILSVGAQEAKGVGISAVAPQFAPALELICQRATRAAYGSPMLEAPFHHRDGSKGVLGLIVQPLADRATGKAYVLVLARDLTDLTRKEASLESRIARQQRSSPHNEPTLDFLLDTLMVRPSIRLRNGISYLTLRTWRQSLRQYQMAAIKSIKRHNAPQLSERVAEEIISALSMLVGQGPFRTIVPMPCGHSGHDHCLSVQIAEALGKRLGIKVIHAFQHQSLAGTSHPKTNARRPKMKLIREVNDATLLIDDIATSGAHIEEAVKLLRQHSHAVLPVAWIGGTAAK
jgi:PAS domain S-box-containing protein